MSPVGARSEFQVAFTQQGIQALQDSLRTIAGTLGQVDTAQRRVNRSGSELGRSFRNIALRTVAYLGIVRGFRIVNNALRTAVSTGIEYNEVIETSTLGIASLIAAQADLIASTGEQLEGVEKMDAAYELATDQVKKLRIAGIQTAATTQELVDAFQQATGAGIAAGLSLDEIRQVTIRLAQAAGALGIPYRQLNEEIRSLLSGTIDQNTRIAKALGIQNETVVAMREQGRLAEFLLDRFEAFGIAGERIVETWGALRSNIAEAFELLAGEATFPLFEELRTRGLEQLGRIFDFDTAEIAEEFAQIVATLQDIFRGVGERLAGVIEGAVDNAARLNQWLTSNRDAVDDTIAGIGSAVRGLGEMARAMARVAGLGVQVGVEMGIIAQAAETFGDVFRAIARDPILAGLATASFGAGILGIISAVAGPAATQLAAVSTVILGVVSALDAMTESAAEATEAANRLRQELNRQAVATTENFTEVARIVAELDKLRTALREGRVETERLEDVQHQMESLLRRLNRLMPDYADQIVEAANSERDFADALRDALRAQDAVLVSRLRALEVERRAAVTRAEELRQMIELRREQDAAARLSPGAGPGERAAAAGAAGAGLPDPTRGVRARAGAFGELSGMRDELIALEEALADILDDREDIREARELIADLLSAGAVTLEGPDTTSAEDTLKARASALEAVADAIKQEMREDEAELKSRFDRNLINFVQYYDELTAIHVEGLTEQARIFEQIAALYEETDPEKAESFRTKALKAESDARIKLFEIETQRQKASLDFTQEAANRTAQILQLQGRNAEAVRFRMTAELDAIREALEALGEVGEEEIIKAEQIIDLSAARARLSELEDEIARSAQRLRNRIQEIEAQVQIGTISRPEGRRRLIEAYREQEALLRRIIPLAEALAEQIGDPQVVAQVEALKAELRALGVEIETLSDRWRDFQNEVGELAASHLGNFFADAAIEAENFGDVIDNLGGNLDSLRNLIGNLLADIIRLISRMIAAQIIISAFRGLGLAPPPGLVGFKDGGRVGFAGGGLLRGAGTGTSDSMIARVSTGEYVVRAAAVRKYGPSFFHALNAGALSRDVVNLRRYATGGLVGGNEGIESGKDFRGELTVGLSEGLVVDQMNTPEGERLIVKVVAKNRRSLLGR